MHAEGRAGVRADHPADYPWDYFQVQGLKMKEAGLDQRFDTAAAEDAATVSELEKKRALMSKQGERVEEIVKLLADKARPSTAHRTPVWSPPHLPSAVRMPWAVLSYALRLDRPVCSRPEQREAARPLLSWGFGRLRAMWSPVTSGREYRCLQRCNVEDSGRSKKGTSLRRATSSWVWAASYIEASLRKLPATEDSTITPAH